LKAIGLARPHPHETICGDAWLALEKGNGLRVALVDGAGHGVRAAEASRLALASVRETLEDSLATAIGRCHDVLRSTRGGVISLADLDSNSVTFAGVGNVDCRLISTRGQRRLVPQRGLVGMNIPTVRPETVAMDATPWALLMNSDGVTQSFRMSWEDITSQAPEAALGTALDRWGRLTDDATIVLVIVSDTP
jgi:serine phosphatase RsbU (regulator of sigma subunit)